MKEFCSFSSQCYIFSVAERYVQLLSLSVVDCTSISSSHYIQNNGIIIQRMIVNMNISVKLWQSPGTFMEIVILLNKAEVIYIYPDI